MINRQALLCDLQKLLQRLEADLLERSESADVPIPGDHQAMLDGKAIPVISPGQRTRIPEKWIRNEHRAIRLEKTGT